MRNADIDAAPQLDADSTRVAPLGSSASQTRNNGPPQPLPMTGGAPRALPDRHAAARHHPDRPNHRRAGHGGRLPGPADLHSMAPMAGMPPQPQLYPTLPYGSMPIQNQVPADYNPFIAAGGGGPVYATMRPPGSDGYPTAAFGSMSLGSSSSGVGGGGSPVLHQTIPSHNPAFAPPQQPQSPASAPYATMRPQPPPKPQGWSTGTLRPSSGGQPPQ
ncbi:uncharacterized protein ACA1_127580 [Acanthamoeba castellanii str. Neff]|uniref:Uncharacterized protein n=1 Tax=Acanthamoeba castellanii (strain ATCC 30010 / Neff) TaxID=1257118 RepID=L8GE14_ACACF|nr:uncharacterized protein ACA1_127580 [Acanthamoeba castellanii str. Neff]ELR11267.1 hypothetical protein ACA1_127580 [Acanthamoeba castellanii str. Neff]